MNLASVDLNLLVVLQALLEERSATKAAATQLKALAPRFDASKAVVEQREATSKDGTKIPYFMLHPKGMALDGNNPTILYAYGGFEASMTPAYNEDAGKLWVEQGLSLR